MSSKEEEDGSRKQALMGGVAQLSRIIKFDSVLQTENQAGGHVMNNTKDLTKVSRRTPNDEMLWRLGQRNDEQPNVGRLSGWTSRIVCAYLSKLYNR